MSFSNLFTIYDAVKPPEIYKDNPTLDIQDIQDTNIILNPMVTAIDNPTLDLEYANLQNPFLQDSNVEQAPHTEHLDSIQKPTVEYKGPESFEKAFEKAVEINPEVANYRNFLVKTAKRESNFNSRIQNRAGAPYYGYFQMGKEEIKRTTGLSVEQFRNDPVRQILGAVKLYKMNLTTIKAIGAYTLCKDRGYTDDAIVSGAWMGGPGGVKKFITGKGDPSDSHWYKGGKGGSSVGKIMNNWMKNE